MHKIKLFFTKLCIRVADWISHPLCIILLPIFCAVYLYSGGEEGRLTLILSILAISLTQMVLQAQNVDAAETKLQIAELVKATPKASNVVIKNNLDPDDVKKMREEIGNEISD